MEREQTTIRLPEEIKNQRAKHISKEELHCIARIIQSSFYAPDESPVYGCGYCKYGIECQKHNFFRMDSVRKKLGTITGVDLSPACTFKIEEKFLKESFQEVYPEEYKKLKAGKGQQD